MDFSYENQGANTYLVYEIKEGDSIDTLSLGMLTNNSIPGLTRALFTQMDEKRYIKYNVSSKVSMQQFFGGVVSGCWAFSTGSRRAFCRRRII